MSGLMAVKWGVCAAAVLLLPVFASAAEGPVQVGVTTAATLVATGTPPSRAERILEVGTDLVANERLVTSETGRVHLMFRDGSSLTVGPNSDLVLNEYLYDPNAKTGKIVFAATKGVFRFVGGSISKETPVEFRTPVATLGIRGGINQFTLDGATGKITTTHIFGEETTITLPNGETTTIARQEFQGVVLPGGNISTGRLTSDQFTAINWFFERPEGVPLVGLPAAGGVGASAIHVPSIEKLAPAGGSGLAGLGTIAIKAPVDISAVQRTVPTVTPPPPASTPPIGRR